MFTNSGSEIQVLKCQNKFTKFDVYIFDVAQIQQTKFNRQNMRYKIQLRHPGTQEKQTILHRPITLHSTSHATLMQEVLRLMSHACGSYCSSVNKHNDRHFRQHPNSPFGYLSGMFMRDSVIDNKWHINIVNENRSNFKQAGIR